LNFVRVPWPKTVSGGVLTDTQLGYLDGQDKECEYPGDILSISGTLNTRLVFRYSL